MFKGLLSYQWDKGHSHSINDLAVRRLWLLTLLRLPISITLVAIVVWGNPILSKQVGVVSPALLAIIYFLAACSALWMLQLSHVNWRSQLYVQLFVDLIMLTLLVHTLGGGVGGYSMLMMFPLAAAATLLQWPFALFTAAVTTLGLLMDGLWRQNLQQLSVDWVAIGVQGGASFALVVTLRYAADRSEKAVVAARTAQAHSALAQVLQEQAFNPSAPSVVVVGPTFELLTFNKTAHLLALQAQVLLERGVYLNQTPALRSWYQACMTQHETQTPWPPHAPSDTVFIRASTLPDAPAHTMLVFELASARQKTAQAHNLTSLGRLTASVAHEIRNPLAAITQAGQLLQESAHLQPTDQSLLQMVQDNAQRIERIVTDVLSWSKVLRVEPSKLELNDAIHKLSQELLTQGLLQEMPLIVTGTAREAALWCDPTHFKQILSNLLGNAAHCVSSTGGALSIHTHARDYGVLIAVLDSGAPVSHTIKDHLFEPFQTGHAQGTGLGLFLAREYARANGGNVHFLDPQTDPESCLALVPKPYTKAFVVTLPWHKT